jgi:hypothetical protein
MVLRSKSILDCHEWAVVPLNQMRSDEDREKHGDLQHADSRTARERRQRNNVAIAE